MKKPTANAAGFAYLSIPKKPLAIEEVDASLETRNKTLETRRKSLCKSEQNTGRWLGRLTAK